MKKKYFDSLVCPKCLNSLELKNEKITDEVIESGKISCLKCNLDFFIKEGAAIFGLETKNAEERFKEIKGENRWTYDDIDIKDHINFAIKSARVSLNMIKKLKTINQKKGKLKVLDIGSGWGCFQSLQFAKEDYNVVAVDICPEFILSSNEMVKKKYFERIVSDSNILPFIDNSFDIIFCKELIHHMNNPKNLLNELTRVASSDGIIIIREPCTSILLKNTIAKKDKAIKSGITHYYFSYFDYINYLNEITMIKKINCCPSIINSHNHKFINSLQKVILFTSKIKFLKNTLLKLHLIFLGGSIEIYGINKNRYIKQNRNKVGITPINVKIIDNKKVEFYRKELIPKVYNIFSKTKK